MAHNESWVQALACCQPDPACIHTRRTEGIGRESGRSGLGGVPGTICCLSMTLAVIEPWKMTLNIPFLSEKVGKFLWTQFIMLHEPYCSSA